MYGVKLKCVYFSGQVVNGLKFWLIYMYMYLAIAWWVCFKIIYYAKDKMWNLWCKMYGCNNI